MNGETAFALLSGRRSIREFTAERIPRPVLERILAAAVTAPSSTNRQPWRFAVVTRPALKAAVVAAVRERAEEMKAIIRRGHHADDFGNYGDFFHEPLATAAAIVVPQYRVHDDLIANLIASGGGDPARFHTAASMQAELCSTAAAVMALLVQAHGEGFGGCWMAGPMVAKDRIGELLEIREPWKMLGAVALGRPAAQAGEKPARKPVEQVVRWFDEEDG